MSTEAEKGRRTGGYHKRAKDYITVEECVILIHDNVARALERERQRRSWRYRIRSWFAARRLRSSADDITLGVG